MSGGHVPGRAQTWGWAPCRQGSQPTMRRASATAWTRAAATSGSLTGGTPAGEETVKANSVTA